MTGDLVTAGYIIGLKQSFLELRTYATFMIARKLEFHFILGQNPVGLVRYSFNIGKNYLSYLGNYFYF